MFKKKEDEEIIVKSKPNDEEVEETLEEETVEMNKEEDEPQKSKKSLFKIKKKSEKSDETEKEQEKKVVKWGPNRILQCFAYFAVILIAVVMILRLIFKDNANPDIVVYMQGISEALAYIVSIWLGFYFTRKRGNVWWLIGWIVASVILVIFYIFAVV